MRSRPLKLNQALALGKLEEFVRQEESRGAELVQGSEFERALALLITLRLIRTTGTRISKPKSRARASSHPFNASL
jgi:hypothetical protein